MARSEIIGKYVAAIQPEIVSCPNEQPFEGGEVSCWISGCPTNLLDILMDHDVPEDLQDEVVSHLRCPKCDSAFDIWQEVGTKYHFEQAHEATVDQALRIYGKQLFGFYRFLHDFPMLGATHPFGKKIICELKKAPRISLNKPDWFRARKAKEHLLGLPPTEKIPDQRYNSSGQARWYFSENPQAAVAEVARSGEAWVQRFEIGSLDGLLDLRSWRADDERALDQEGDYHPPHSLLLVSLVYGDLLTQRNYGDDEGRQWKPEYLVTRFIGEAASLCGFSGILCSSVRYSGENLIVFDPNWCPKKMGEPYLLKLDESEMQTRDGLFWNQGQLVIFGNLPVIESAEPLANQCATPNP